MSGTSTYEQLLSSSALIPSGIKSLDELLLGGFLTGTVFELCGQTGEGKTQICLTMCAHVAAVLKQVVHYVDTKSEFSARRVLDIFKCSGLSEEECKAALNKIAVTKVSDIYELIRYLHHLKTSLAGEESSTPRLVIVDSMPAVYFPFLGNEGTQGFGLLNQVMAMMKALATEYHILFLEVNLASMFVEADVTGVDAEDDTTPVSEARPMLGKYWLHAPNTRLLLSRPDNEDPQVHIRVVKSTYLSLGASCVVTISQQGVV